MGRIRWHVVVRDVAIAAWVIAGLRALHFLFFSIGDWRHSIGIDHAVYMSATSAWLQGGSFYLPHTIEGTYQVMGGEVLYPPVALWLFAPFTVLPGFLWWAIPLALTVAAVRRMHPTPMGWLAMGLLAMTPVVQGPIFWGNPAIWLVPAVAWGLLAGWPLIMILAKPTLAPVALLGARRRSWWVTLAMFAVLGVPFGGLWLTWLRVTQNATNLDLLYSVPQLALLALPVAAWLSGEQGRLAARGGVRDVRRWAARVGRVAERSGMPVPRGSTERLALVLARIDPTGRR